MTAPESDSPVATHTDSIVRPIGANAVVRAANLPADPREPQEEAFAWIRAMEAGLARLEELHDEPWVDPTVVQRLRDTFELRLAQYSARKEGEEDRKAEKRVRAGRHLRRDSDEVRTPSASTVTHHVARLGNLLSRGWRSLCLRDCG